MAPLRTTSSFTVLETGVGSMIHPTGANPLVLSSGCCSTYRARSLSSVAFSNVLNLLQIIMEFFGTADSAHDRVARGFLNEFIHPSLQSLSHGWIFDHRCEGTGEVNLPWTVSLLLSVPFFLSFFIVLTFFCYDTKLVLLPSKPSILRRTEQGLGRRLRKW